MRLVSFILIALSLLGIAYPAVASTAAGTLISNQVTVKYTIDGVDQMPSLSNTANFYVDEVVDVVLTWQDAAPRNVSSPQTNAALTFTISNTGNGTEAFSLSRNNTLADNAFTPLTAAQGSIYFENGLQGGFQATGPNADTLYIPGTNDPTLAAGASQTVYVNSDIEPSVAQQSLAGLSLSAASVTPGLANSEPGSSFTNSSNANWNIVTGQTRGVGKASGKYVVGGVNVFVQKVLLSPTTDKLIPGVLMQYRILVELAGAGAVSNLNVQDPMPAEINYVANSATLNGEARSDSADSDNLQFTNNTLNILLGNATAPSSYSIDFKATLK